MRVVVQSTRRLFSEALVAVLEADQQISLVNRVALPEHLLALCELSPLDVAVIDADGDVSTVVPTCRALRDRFPAIYLVVVYEKLAPTELAAVRNSGVCAIVPCSHGLKALVAALRNRPLGELWPQPAGLTERQRDVLLLLGSGHSVHEISALLHISPGTVESHKRRLYAKLKATGGVQAIARAAALGIVNDGFAHVNGRVGLHPTRHPAGEPGRALLTVVHGQDGPLLRRVLLVLSQHQLPVVRESAPQRGRSDHWSRWHRGGMVVLLVDPSPDDWRAALALARPVVVIWSEPVAPAEVTKALVSGAGAVVPPERVGPQLVGLLAVAAQGYVLLDPAQAGSLLSAATAPAADSNSGPQDITPREYDILRSIASGHTVRQTARTLGIAVKTVENTQSHMFRKLGAHNRSSALVAAYSLGVLPDLPADPGGNGRRTENGHHRHNGHTGLRPHTSIGTGTRSNGLAGNGVPPGVGGAAGGPAEAVHDGGPHPAGTRPNSANGRSPLAAPRTWRAPSVG